MLGFSNRELFETGKLDEYVVTLEFTTPSFYGTGSKRLEVIKLKMIQGTTERSFNLLEAPPGPYGEAYPLPGTGAFGIYDIPMNWFQPFDNGDIKLELYWGRFTPTSPSGKLADVGNIKLEPDKMSISNTLGDLIATIEPGGVTFEEDDIELRTKVPCDKIYNVGGRYKKVTFIPHGQILDAFLVKTTSERNGPYYLSNFNNISSPNIWFIKDTGNDTVLVQDASQYGSSVRDRDTLTISGNWTPLKNTTSESVKIPMTNICETTTSGAGQIAREEAPTKVVEAPQPTDTTAPTKTGGSGVELRNGNEVFVNVQYDEDVTLDITGATMNIGRPSADSHNYQIDTLDSGSKTYTITATDSGLNTTINEVTLDAPSATPDIVEIVGNNLQDIYNINTSRIIVNGIVHTYTEPYKWNLETSENTFLFYRIVIVGHNHVDGRCHKEDFNYGDDSMKQYGDEHYLSVIFKNGTTKELYFKDFETTRTVRHIDPPPGQPRRCGDIYQDSIEYVTEFRI